MSLIKINLKPTDKELRLFGLAALVASILVTALLYLVKGLAFQWCGVIVGIGVVIFLCSIVSMTLIRWIYLGLTLLTFPIGLAISFMVLAVFYYCVLTPLGLIFRLFGRDPLRLKFEKAAKSYWVAHRPSEKNERYFSQF